MAMNVIHPGSWEAAAGEQLSELYSVIDKIPTYMEWLEDVEDMLPNVFEVATIDVDELRATFHIIGAVTLAHSPLDFWDVYDTLVGKQRDYGHGNINKHGLFGIVVRMSDKIERLKNLTGSGATPNNESVNDTFLDIVGYATIALMLIDGTFQRQLRGAA